MILQKKAINKTQEVQGFREAMAAGVEIDAIAHFSDPVLETNRSIRERGLRATLDSYHGH